jgi:beta-galactosidase
MGTFEIKKEGFYLNNEPFRIIAGAIHYFRVPREYWRDRLIKLKACGFNAVETYAAWNLHEKEEGKFDYDDMLDIESFLALAEELGLYAIVRPGPYICSEWEFGGLPWWLLKNDEMHLRCMDKDYLAAVERFYADFIPRIAKHQITEGGNVIFVQVENEYGSYGDDSEYIRYIAELLKKNGITVPLFTSDGTEYQMLTGGTVPEIHKTANFGSRAKENFEKLREYQPDGPLMCTEFWNGWFDHWTEEHHHRDPKEAAECFDEVLAAGASISCYMFHGGTNFGYMNGANNYDKYEPTVSSYDDDAPVGESGNLTEKYHLIKDVISKYAPIPDVEMPKPIKKKKYGEIAFTKSAKLFDNLENLAEPKEIVAPVPMEKLNQGYGYILYKTHVRGPRNSQPVYLQEVHDRGYIYKDRKLLGIQYRNDKENNISAGFDKDGNDLYVLVENMGRVNYGAHLKDYKGVTEGIRLGNSFVYHWQAYNLTFEDISKVKFNDGVPEFDGEPVLLKADIDIDECCDTFVKLPGFKKGIIIINGKILSRYWEVGPQKSAYLPAPFLKKGKNELVIIEFEGYDNAIAILDDEEELG